METFYFMGYLFLLKFVAIGFVGTVFVGIVFVTSIISSHITTESTIILLPFSQVYLLEFEYNFFLRT